MMFQIENPSPERVESLKSLYFDTVVLDNNKAQPLEGVRYIYFLDVVFQT